MSIDPATTAALTQAYTGKLTSGAIGQIGSWDVFSPALDKTMAAAADALYSAPGAAPVADVPVSDQPDPASGDETG